MNRKKVVLVTGAGQGLGACLARAYADEGFVVIGVDFSEPGLREAEREYGLHPIVLDVSSEDAWIEAIMQIERLCPAGLDVCVANAAVLRMGSATEVSLSAWHLSLGANLTGALLTARFTLPLLEKAKGNLVFIGSVASVFAAANEVSYISTKHGLVGMMRSIALDYGPKGIRCNLVAPGWMRTPMSSLEMEVVMKRYDCSLEEAFARATSPLPLRRPGDMSEVANVVKFISSDQASFVTGSSLAVDGGSSVVDVGYLAMEEATGP